MSKKDKRREQKEEWRRKKKLQLKLASDAGALGQEFLNAQKGMSETESKEFVRRLEAHKRLLEEDVEKLKKYGEELEEYTSMGAQLIKQGLDPNSLPEPVHPDPIPELDAYKLAEQVKNEMSPYHLSFESAEELGEYNVFKAVESAIKELSQPVRDIFIQNMDERTRRIEAGEEDPPFKFDFKQMIDDAEQAVKQRPDQRVYKAQVHTKPEDQSVESFLDMMAYCLRIARFAEKPEIRTEASRFYHWFRDARVFHIGRETFKAVYQEADRYTTELAGGEYTFERGGTSPLEADEYLRVLTEAAKQQVWPETFPFPSIYLGYGDSCILPKSFNYRAPRVIRDRITVLRLLGHLVVASGNAVACFRCTLEDGQTIAFLDPCYFEGTWPRGLELEPWILPHLIRVINDHRTFVLETEIPKAIRQHVKENRKALTLDDYKYMPRPYYTLKMQSNIIQEKVRKSLGRPPKPKTYKTDVRGHERCRIRRGPLPIDPVLAAKLEKRGYVIFATNQLDASTYQRLSQRGLAYKRADEWLAVKASWIKDHMTSVDPNLPYIPAVRQLGSVKTNTAKPTGAWTEDPASR